MKERPSFSSQQVDPSLSTTTKLRYDSEKEDPEPGMLADSLIRTE